LTVKVPEVFPEAIVSVAGTVASVFEVAIVITRPPVGAAPVRVTVPVELLPPTTLDGLKVKLAMVGGMTVSVVETDTEPSVAPSFTAV